MENTKQANSFFGKTPEPVDYDKQVYEYLTIELDNQGRIRNGKVEIIIRKMVEALPFDQWMVESRITNHPSVTETKHAAGDWELMVSKFQRVNFEERPKFAVTHSSLVRRYKDGVELSGSNERSIGHNGNPACYLHEGPTQTESGTVHTCVLRTRNIGLNDKRFELSIISDGLFKNCEGQVIGSKKLILKDPGLIDITGKRIEIKDLANSKITSIPSDSRDITVMFEWPMQIALEVKNPYALAKKYDVKVGGSDVISSARVLLNFTRNNEFFRTTTRELDANIKEMFSLIGEPVLQFTHHHALTRTGVTVSSDYITTITGSGIKTTDFQFELSKE